MKTIQWGMVGTGDVTEKKSGPGLYKAKNSILYGVTNRTRAKAEDYAKRHGVGKVYDNIEEMLADPEIDIIYIATPPASHKEYAFKCAKAKKPCYIEKPVSLNAEECGEMIKAFEESGTKAFAAYYRRRLPRFVKAKELLEGGAIGDVRFVHVCQYRPASAEEKENCWRVQPKISGGGVFMDVAVHQLDILDFLLGRISEVKSIYGNQAHYYEPEDMLNICFSFESGVQGSGDWCFTAGVAREEIEIVGSKGRLIMACFGTGPILVETDEGIEEFPEPTPEHIQQPLIQSIVDELNGEDVCPSTLYTALRTAWVCDEVYRRK
jgi:predicted dehydrogenase